MGTLMRWLWAGQWRASPGRALTAVVAIAIGGLTLDARQIQMGMAEPMPVLFFTQLLALAFGLPPKAAALDKNLIDPRPLLRKKQVLGAASRASP